MDSDLFSSLSKEEKYLLSYSKDLLSAEGSISYFLNERERFLIASFFRNKSALPFTFFGGYPEAERTVLFVGKEMNPLFYKRIIPLRITLQGKMKPLRHGSVLGSILSLGLKRNILGDILILSENCAVVFVLSDMALYLEKNLIKIGGDSGTVKTIGYDEISLPEKRREELSFTIASCRIDCLLGGILKKSRGSSVSFFSDGNVFLNQQQVFSSSKKISAGDKISVRGFGKYEVNDMIETKTGRLRVCVSKFL